MVIFCWGFWGILSSAEGNFGSENMNHPKSDHYRSVFWPWTDVGPSRNQKKTGAIRGVSQQKRGKTTTMIEKNNWLVVSTPLKNTSQNGNLPQVGVKIKNVWNHHLVLWWLQVWFSNRNFGGFCSISPHISPKNPSDACHTQGQQGCIIHGTKSYHSQVKWFAPATVQLDFFLSPARRPPICWNEASFEPSLRRCSERWKVVFFRCLVVFHHPIWKTEKK